MAFPTRGGRTKRCGGNIQQQVLVQEADLLKSTATYMCYILLMCYSLPVAHEYPVLVEPTLKLLDVPLG